MGVSRVIGWDEVAYIIVQMFYPVKLFSPVSTLKFGNVEVSESGYGDLLHHGT